MSVWAAFFSGVSIGIVIGVILVGVPVLRALGRTRGTDE
jgi:hypothetical protein